MSDVIVIGAGVLGASTAHYLADAGARVTVLEAAQVARGASAASFAVDITRVKTPRALFELSLASAEEHARLQESHADSEWRHPVPTLEWEADRFDRQRLQHRVERLHNWGYPARWLSVTNAREIEPALDPGMSGDLEIALFAAGAWYDPAVFARALLDSAVRRGTVLLLGDPVTGMEHSDGRIGEVRTASGARFRSEIVVNCAGPQAGEVAALAGVDLPIRRVPGLVVVTTPAPANLRTILAAPDLNIRPHIQDRVMLHSWSVDSELVEVNEHRLTDLASDLLQRARNVLPALAGVTVQASAVGIRPVPPDGLPLVGHLAAQSNLYTVVAHSAVHLAPILGRLAARELTGHPQSWLAPFRPTPLRSGSAKAAVLDENTRTMLAQIEANDPEEPAHAS